MATTKEVQINKVRWRDTYRQMDNYKMVGTVKISPGGFGVPGPASGEPVNVRVFHERPLAVLEAALRHEFTPVLLNIFDNNYPFDALKGGAAGDQFEILRRTNFFNTLSDGLYPLQEQEAFFSERLYLFKNAEYRTIKKPPKFAMISIVPPKNPRILTIAGAGDTYENPNDEKMMRAKIQSVFDLAASRSFDCLILQDIGCKVHNNPIHKIVEFLNEEIAKAHIPNVFFAVYNQPTELKDENFLYFHDHIRRF
jgi:hypothetical protein